MMHNIITPYNTSKAYIIHTTAGAILAMGRRGRETTLWPVQEEFFDNKFFILWLQTNLWQLINRSFVQDTADNAP